MTSMSMPVFCAAATLSACAAADLYRTISNVKGKSCLEVLPGALISTALKTMCAALFLSLAFTLLESAIELSAKEVTDLTKRLSMHAIMPRWV